MKIKNYSVLLLLMLLVSIAVAQSSEESRTRFGILAGVNFQNLTGSDADGDKLTNDMITGFHAGVNVQIPIVPEFYFQPGLMFSTKGAENNGDGFSAKYKLAYIEVPMNFVYKASLGTGYVMVGFGPYVAYGVMGTLKFEGGDGTTEMDIVFQDVVETSDNPALPYLKAIDVGANILAGYEMSSGVFLQLNSQLGMLDLSPEYKGIENDKSSLKNTGFGLSLGYRF